MSEYHHIARGMECQSEIRLHTHLNLDCAPPSHALLLEMKSASTLKAILQKGPHDEEVKDP